MPLLPFGCQLHEDRGLLFTTESPAPRVVSGTYQGLSHYLLKARKKGQFSQNPSVCSLGFLLFSLPKLLPHRVGTPWPLCPLHEPWALVGRRRLFTSGLLEVAPGLWRSWGSAAMECSRASGLDTPG